MSAAKTIDLRHPLKVDQPPHIRNLVDIDDIKSAEVIVCPWCGELVEGENDLNHYAGNTDNCGMSPSYDSWDDFDDYFDEMWSAWEDKIFNTRYAMALHENEDGF